MAARLTTIPQYILPTMIIKEADDRQPQLDQLEALLGDPHLLAEHKAQLQRELRTLRTEIARLRDSAGEIDPVIGPSTNRIVIHDLRLEHDGVVVRIDHLVLNRLLEVYVLETSHFGADLTIDEKGQFSILSGATVCAIPSPLTDNALRVTVLKEVFKGLDMPTRLGFRLQPSFESIVLVSTRARITRPATRDTERVIKSDQLVSWMDKNPASATAIYLGKVVSIDTLTDIGRQLVALHRPLAVDDEPRLGIATEEV